ncbi:SSCRP protein [Ophiocordyceps camponoti-floridani]|uniref:SSCRP protein n=1 Tax=Ophiocordyceps camponoti-floridani TaxID=2030778 RepID=A0A8H4Q0I0_9HYPO|nr:SSCRP protein [Ophiocordyceps camponoti-floridani]
MLISSIATALVLAASCLAHPKIRRKQTDLRLFSGDNCTKGNLGVWTVVEGDLFPGECKMFPVTVGSVGIESIYDGCTVTLYVDDECKPVVTMTEKKLHTGDQAIVEGCVISRTGMSFKAFTVSCDFQKKMDEWDFQHH